MNSDRSKALAFWNSKYTWKTPNDNIYPSEITFTGMLAFAEDYAEYASSIASTAGAENVRLKTALQDLIKVVFQYVGSMTPLHVLYAEGRKAEEVLKDKPKGPSQLQYWGGSCV